MTLRQNRLKKGQVNLLTLKNKSKKLQIIAFLFLILLFILCTNIKNEQNTKEAQEASFVHSEYHFLTDDDVKLSAKLDGGFFVSNVMGIGMNNAEILSAIPHKFSYEFDGWYFDNQFQKPVRPDSIVASPVISIYAKWIRKIDNYYNVRSYTYTTEKEKDSKTLLLKDLDFSFLDDVEIPGISLIQNDSFFDSIFHSQSQTPQGLCFTTDFIITTSYSNEDECLGELVVFDRETEELLAILGLDPNSHLGGLTFDGKNIWVCNSHEGTIERISYDFVKLMAYQNTGKYVDASELVDSYPVSNRPSCIAYYDGRIWVATHSIYFRSKMVSYHYDKDKNELTTFSTYKIPSQVQGLAFDTEGRVCFSRSYGRNISSYITIYNSVVEMEVEPAKPLVSIEMPPASEEIDIVDGVAYVIFESACEEFLKGTDGYGICKWPINKILRLDLSDVLQ